MGKPKDRCPSKGQLIVVAIPPDAAGVCDMRSSNFPRKVVLGTFNSADALLDALVAKYTTEDRKVFVEEDHRKLIRVAPRVVELEVVVTTGAELGHLSRRRYSWVTYDSLCKKAAAHGLIPMPIEAFIQLLLQPDLKEGGIYMAAISGEAMDGTLQPWWGHVWPNEVEWNFAEGKYTEYRIDNRDPWLFVRRPE